MVVVDTWATKVEMISDLGIRFYLSLVFQVISALGVLVAIYVSLHNRDRLEVLKVNIDGKMEDLLNTTRALATLQGNVAGRSEKVSELASASRELLDEASTRQSRNTGIGSTVKVEGQVTTDTSGISAELHKKDNQV